MLRKIARSKFLSKTGLYENLNRLRESASLTQAPPPASTQHRRARLHLEPLEDREVPAVVPVVSLGVNSTPFIGAQNVPVSITFTNPTPTSTAPGFGPWVYAILPGSGTDGDDGITFAGGATFLGSPIAPTVMTVPVGGNSVTGPAYALAPVGTTGEQPIVIGGLNPGDQVVFFQLPYISYSLNQPGGTITFNTNVSNLADNGAPLTIRAGGGFALGTDELDNPSTGDVPILAATATTSSTPQLFTVEKVYVGPEQETATGPNFVRSYTVNVRVAPGQTLNAFQLADLLAPGMQFIPGSVTTTTPNFTGTAGTTATAAIPGGSVVANFSSISGDSDVDTVDATFTFDFFVPRVDANNTVILDPTTGAFRDQTDTVTGTGNWTPIDTRDPAGPVSSAPVTDTFTAKSVAIQKGVTVVGGNGLVQQGANLQYTINFQISDYFAFASFQIPDLLPDGVRFLTTFVPTLTLTNPNGAGFSGTFSPTNYYVGGTRTGSFVAGDYNTDGTQTIWFDISSQIANSPLLGGWIPAGGTGGPVPDPTTYGNTPTAPFAGLAGTITFQAQVQNNYSVTGGGTNVKQGDVLTNIVPTNPADPRLAGVPGQTPGGEVLNDSNLSGTGNDQSDNTSASVTVRTGTITKTIYAINGVVGTYNNPTLQDGDTVTYRLTYVLPTGSASNFSLTDYLPLPVFAAPSVTTGNFTTPQTTAPAAGTATYGPGVGTPPSGVTLPPGAVNYGQAGIAGQNAPTITTNGATNTVQFVFPTNLQDPLQQASFVDILFTVQVRDVPVADGFPLTNQANATEGNTTNVATPSNAIVPVTLGRPNLTVTKGVVGSSNPAAVITPNRNDGVTFNGPNDAVPFAGGTISSSGLDSSPITGDISRIDAADSVQFAVVVQNTGSGPQGAYDVLINDTIPTGFIAPTAGLGLNLQFRDGTGVGGSVTAAIAAGYTFFDSMGGSLTTQAAVEAAFFSGGVRISGSGPTGAASATNPMNAGVIDGFNATNGQNVLVITYDLRAETPLNPTDPAPVSANQVLQNTATVTSYTATPGGVNFAPTNVGNLTDTAQAQIAPPTVTKSLVSTSIEDDTIGNGRNQAVIGEIATYRVTVTVPDGVTNNLQILDTLDSGLVFRQVVSVSTGSNVTSTQTPGTGTAPPNVSVTSQGQNLTFNFGTVTTTTSAANGTAAGNTLTITYEVVVLNATGNVRGVGLNNSARVSYTNATNTETYSSNTANAPNVTVIEPVVNTTKSYTISGTGANSGNNTTTGTGQFGNTVTYTIMLSNPTLVAPPGSTPNTTTAYDVTLRDVLNTANITFSPTITYVSGPGAYSASNFTIIGGVLQTVSPLASLLPGETITLTVTGTINGNVTPNQLITNTATDTWTSLPGNPGTLSTYSANSVERTGNPADPGQLNNYTSSSTADFRISTPAPVKTLVTTSEASTTSNNVAVGEVATYRLQIQVPRSTLTNLQLIDNIGSSLGYLPGSARVVFVSNPPGLVTSSTLSGGNLQQTTLPAAGVPLNASNSIELTSVTVNPTNLVFSLGDVLNTAPDSNDGPEYIIVEFQAVVLNNAANQSGSVLPNTFQSFVNGSANGDESAPVNVTVVEPNVGVQKQVAINGGAPGATRSGDGGDSVTYTVRLTNSGNATAFNTLLSDTIPSFITGATISGVSGGGFGTGDFTIAGGILQTTSATGIDLPSTAGSNVVTITITGALSDAVNPGQSIPNTANITYTSLPGTNGTGNATPGAPGTATGERTGSGVGPNDYASTNTATVTVPAPTVTKSLVSTSLVGTTGNSVNVGESATFGIVVTVPQGTTPGLVITDALPPGMVFTGFTVANTAAGSSGLLAGDFNGTGATAANITLSGGSGAGGAFLPGDDPVFTFNNSILATGTTGTANNQFVIFVTARVADVASNTRGTTLPDSASGSYQGTNPGSIAPTANVTLTVTEPQLQVAKTVVGDSTLDGGATATYQLIISHTGLSNGPAYLVDIRDAVPAGLTFVAGSATIVSSTGATNPAIVTNGPTLRVTADELALTGSITITYQVTVNAPGGAATPVPTPGTSITNTATTDATSAPTDGRSQTQAQGQATVIVNTNTVSGFVYVDADNDGTRDAGETPLGNVTVRLTGTDIYGQPVSLSTVTLANGAYQFTGLRPGTYTVTEDRVATGPNNTVNTGLTWADYTKGFDTPGTTFGPAGGPIAPTTQTPATSAISPLTIPADSNTSGINYNFGELLNADLSITKDDGSTTYTPGTTITYTIVVTNNGPGNVIGATVADAIPANITGVSWTSMTSGSATVVTGGTGTGNTLASTIDIPAGGTVTYTVTGLVVSSATGNLVNTATVSLPTEYRDPTPGNNTATDTDTPDIRPDLGITKTDGSATYVPGTPITYTIVVRNLGPSDAVGASVADLLPAAITGVSWTAVASGSAAVVTGGTGTGNALASTVNIPAGAGNFITYTVTGTVASGTTGDLTNTATVTAPPGTTDPDPSNNSASDTDTEANQADLTITKTNGQVRYTPNGLVTYTIVVRNVGPSDVTGATVSDVFDTTRLLNVRWTVSGTSNTSGFTDTTAAPATGNINDTVNIGAGGVITYVVTGRVSPAARGALVNTATVTPPTDVIDPTPANNTATDVDLPPTAVRNRLVGRVYLDQNQNAVYQPGIDRPLAGIPITVRNAAGVVVATTTTAADGTYAFANLPSGRLSIRETQPAGYGSSEAPYNVRVVNMPLRGVVANQNFGNTLGSLSGKVYRDYNLNGVFSTNSPNPDTGIRGVRVTLTDANGAFVATTVTDANGNYVFRNLPTGQYTVTETQPPLPTNLTNGYYDGSDNLGSLGGTRPAKNALSTTLGINPVTRRSQIGQNYNFGELPPADPFGFVYVDRNRNGVKDPGEPGIAGVAITISGTAFAGTPFARPLVGADLPGGSLTVFTNAGGFYQFNPMPPGRYTIRETQPAGYIDGREQNGDPSAPAPTIGNDVFTNLLLNPFPIRGPFNFGEFLPEHPSKRNLLGSTM